ncbi:MAG: hypothetical protein IPN72_25160 [Saprospiraceae bacterium]|nr:hypothetical protein [Saprospiraceae bacterium]
MLQRGQGNNLQSIYDIAHQTSLVIEMGGGIRNRATRARFLRMVCQEQSSEVWP